MANLLNNQSILEKITLVEEIDEQAAEIISGGKSGKLLNTGIYALEEPDTTEPVEPGENPGEDPDEGGGDDEPKAYQQANFAFVQNRRWRRGFGNRGRNRNRYC